MNKLLYILLLSFFALSAIGGKKGKSKCGNGFGSKKQALKRQQQQEKFEKKRKRRGGKVFEQNRRQGLPPSNNPLASQEVRAKAKYEPIFEDLRDAGKYKEGLELTSKLLKEGDDTRLIAGWKATFWIKLAMKGKDYINEEEQAEILAFLNESIKKHPTEMYLHSRRGHIHFLLGNHKQSLSDNEFAIRRGSRHHGGLLEAAQSAIYLANSNRLDISSDQSKQLLGKAMKYSQEFLSAVKSDSPNISQAHHILARAFHTKEKYQASIKNYDLAIKNTYSGTKIGTKSNLYRSRAQVISDLADQTSDSSLAINHYKEAIADCEQAIRILGKNNPSADPIFGLKKSITTRMNRLLDSY